MSPSALNTTARNQHRIQNNDNNHQERKASNAEIQRLLAQPDAANDGGNLREPGEYPVHSNALAPTPTNLRYPLGRQRPHIRF